MNMQVLLSTMNQSPDICNKMNVKTDSIIINQCDKNEVMTISNNGKRNEFYSFTERGIGRSRNNALMRASADICLFSDDDVMYCDDYENKILQEFEQVKDADVIIFNIRSTNASRPENEINKLHRIHIYNGLRYGAYQIAIKRDHIWQNNIWFSLMFGGGAQYSCGEDSIFLWDCFKKHLHVYATSTTIGTVSHNESTWFNGFTEKYFIDLGHLYHTLSPKLSFLFCIHYLIKNKNKYMIDTSMLKAYTLMFKGLNI